MKLAYLGNLVAAAILSCFSIFPASAGDSVSAFHEVKQGSVKVTAHLSPTGSFLIESTEIQGQFAIESDQTVKARNFSVPVVNLKTGITLRDEHLQKKYLRAEQFPLLKLTQGSGKEGVFAGELEIVGIAKQVHGTYEVTEKEVISKFSLSLKDFGITGIRYLGVGVKDSVDVSIRLERSTKVP